MIWESVLVLALLISGTQTKTTPNVVIDGYNNSRSILTSPATQPLGTTVILVCRVSGIPHGLQTSYQWTCPNGPCQQTGFVGRQISNNIIAINITSSSDGGEYTCTVTAKGNDFFSNEQFLLNVSGGSTGVVHSYGRLLLNDTVITDKQQLQPPNNDSGDGRIECRRRSEHTEFSYDGFSLTTDTGQEIYEIKTLSNATVVIGANFFHNFTNFEGECGAHTHHYLFLSRDTLPNITMHRTAKDGTSITVEIGTIHSGIDRVIIGYHRLDLGVPVVGEHVNNGGSTSRTFSSLVPGAKYRITAWGLGNGDKNDRRRGKSPAVLEVTTMERTPSPPRNLTISRVFDDGIELNWIPPREPNGDIRHYIIKYTAQDGTQQEFNTTNNTNYVYYNLTGLERGQTYNNITVTVVAVNSAGVGGGSQPITSYEYSSTVNGTNSPILIIDGYTINTVRNSPATLPLGTTIILVCRVSGIPHGLKTNYHWTCPNGSCQQTEYVGRQISNNILAINITSTRDGGTYTCKVTAEGREASHPFQLLVRGGGVVHSYGRLIPFERVITDKQQLQPPNNDSGDGRIECRRSSGKAGFSYTVLFQNTSQEVHQFIRMSSNASIVIRNEAFNNFGNFEGKCDIIHHYLFLSNYTLPDVSISVARRTDTTITVNISTIPDGIARVIIGYHRLDLGVPVVGGYVNNGKNRLRTFFSLVPGATYRITAWGLGGVDDRRRSRSPAVIEVTTIEKSPSCPRKLTISSASSKWIELNWIPPREPNGDIQHYMIKYTTQNGTQLMHMINTGNNTNYYNLTGLDRKRTLYEIRLVAVNSAGGGGESEPLFFYVHGSVVEITGTSSSNSLPTVLIAVVTTANILILLVGCILLMIGAILMVKRKRPTSTVQYSVDSDIDIYDEVGVSKFGTEANDYQELDIDRIGDTQQYNNLQ